MIGIVLADPDNSARLRVQRVLAKQPDLVMVAEIADLDRVVSVVRKHRPDVVLLGASAGTRSTVDLTTRLMSEVPTPLLVLVHPGHPGSSEAAFEATRYGALDIVTLPAETGPETARQEQELLSTLRLCVGIRVVRRRDHAARARGLVHPSDADGAVVGIGASTGGPPALVQLLGMLPADFPAPVLVVQHLTAGFGEQFASWLDGLVPLAVTVASDAQQAEPGVVYIAPDDLHLRLGRGRKLELSDEPAIGGHRPSATPLFLSMARQSGLERYGVLLTGMGDDGAIGLKELRDAGGCTLAQDEQSSVVYGMPRAAVLMGAVAEVGSPRDLGSRLYALLTLRTATDPGWRSEIAG